MVLLPLLLGVLVLETRTEAIGLEEFREKMRKHVASLSAKTSASVRLELLGSGQELFAHQDTRNLVPASNAKLVSTLVALDRLGPGFHFETRVFRKGKSLVLSGNGDPYLVSERLWLLARGVARSGVRTVDSVQVDRSALRETYRGLTDYEGSGEPFTALVSPVALNFNSLEVHLSLSPGLKAEAGPLPSGYAKLRNELTLTGGNGKNISVKPLGARGGTETFVLSGSVGRGALPLVVYGTVGDPEAHIASAFAALLRREGIQVAKDYAPLEPGWEPGAAEPLARQESLPLQDLVRLLNNYSNNFMAELVFFGLSADRPGGATADASRKIAQEFLRKHPSCQDAQLSNGSGLSWETRLSARCLTETMANAYGEFRVFADLLGSLPAGGQTGTLKSRFRRAGDGFDAGKVRGKTGTLWSRQAVSSLAGATTTASGEKVLFALIENDQRNDPGLLRGLKDWEDRCLELLQQLQL